MMTNSPTNLPERKNWAHTVILSLLFVLVLAAAAYFRFSGLDWGEYQFLHPDERFLIWVGTDISPVDSLNAYFNTTESSLNPHNRGHGFYVYGTLPMFLARYLVEWIFGHSGFQEMTDVGRALSALADLGTVFLVYLVGKRLYDQRVGVLAAAFSAATVLQIQQAHFFTMDTFLTFFSFLAFYFATLVIKIKPKNNPLDLGTTNPENEKTQRKNPWLEFMRDPLVLSSLGFGTALGLAVASKLNAAAVAIVLPIAMGLVLIRFWTENKEGGDGSTHKHEKQVLKVFLLLILAALVSGIVFRIAQPYAFSGPGILGVKPNPLWVQNIREQRSQSGGDVDFPPAMQWARRPVWFSLQNLVLWGLGLPLGVLAWAGFLWAGWRLLSGWHRRSEGGYRTSEWDSHLLIWSWTAIYFVWQSIQRNPTMRYQLLIYPTLAIFAAWAVFALYDRSRNHSIGSRKPAWNKIAAALIGVSVLIATTAYAYAFTQIYNRQITRIEASRWIYQNAPGPITLPIETEADTNHPAGIQNQILPFPYDYRILPQLPYTTTFKPKTQGELREILLPNVLDESVIREERNLLVTIQTIPASETPLASGAYTGYLSQNQANEETDGDGTNRKGVSLTIPLDRSIPLDPEQTYELKISLPFGEPISTFHESADLIIEPFSGVGDAHVQTVQLGINELQPGVPLALTFQAEADGMLSQVLLEQQAGGEATRDVLYPSPPQPIGINLQSGDPNEQPIYSAITLQSEPNSSIYQVQISEPFPLEEGGVYRLSLSMEPRGGVVALRGMAIANEGDWDDGLPVRMDGYDGYGGIYPPDLNFNMYWDDNPEKVERFIRILDEADLLTISSNRQWGTLPRIPERFPMTSVYYRELLGCPPEQSVEYCYRVAEPGMYQGNLGYELAQVFVSEPKIGPLRLNDQFAEEAFSVYDHPKVLIFQKTADYDPAKVRAILAGVDLSKIIRKPPLRYANHPEDLLLPEDRWETQQSGGTWSDLFNTQSVFNRFQPLSVLVWYLSLFLLGLVFYPLLRLALPGLKDRGYPLGRISGMLVVSYLSWLAGSLEIPYTRLTISVVIAGMALIGGVLAFQQRRELIQEWRSNRRYFLFVEALGLILFLAFLAVRIGNPDLWHPWKGGEKPMDFSYFNAVLKSTTFPPYDPWYAGGYLNYYYYGFVLVGTWVKWLGITPAIAYNLILPTLFSIIALGAFSLAWNITQRAHPARDAAHAPSDGQPRDITEKEIHLNGLSPYVPALAAALGMAVMGNLGIVKMIYQGYQRLIVPNELIEQSNVILRLGWAMQGFAKTLKGVKLQYGIGDWYWNPSRIIPAAGDVEPITEFPYFTLLYADLHAHLIALPITLLALTFMVGIVLGNARWKSLLGGGLWFALAGLSIGVLRPTNTWDLYPYLALGIISVIYAIWRQEPPDSTESWPDWLRNIPHRIRQPILAVIGAVGLFGLVTLFFQPYTQWYALGYTKIDLWNGSHTPLSAYLNHWGLFLVVILPWMIWETRDWMAKTPVSALRKLRKIRYWILALFLMLWVAVALLVFWREVSIAWFILPLAAWAGILILRPGQPDAKRIVLFLVGSGLTLTLIVEVIVLVGDIGRMNTVFKFYLQVWTMFSISAAAALGWLWPALQDWQRGWRWAWQTAFIMIVAGASLYPMMATLAKIDDRIMANAPHTLDGMAFMPYATYTDEWGQMDLGQDYQAIRWMQENVSGSPVIVEANLRNLYRWGSRYSIYTGLPGVVGWEWHQQQQRAVTPGVWVTDRILEIDDFYLTEDWNQASSFLQKYNVRYIIVGQQERGHYPGPGLEKFEKANGILWNEVFRNETTVIYQVITDNPSDQTGEEIETP